MEAWTPQGYSESSAPLEHGPRGQPDLVLDLERQERLSTGVASYFRVRAQIWSLWSDPPEQAGIVEIG